jgi:hypothetical protein
VTLGVQILRTATVTFMMMKKKNRIEIAKKIISSVRREMQKPRLTESVRSYREQAAPVVEERPRKDEGRSLT